MSVSSIHVTSASAAHTDDTTNGQVTPSALGTGPSARNAGGSASVPRNAALTPEVTQAMQGEFAVQWDAQYPGSRLPLDLTLSLPNVAPARPTPALPAPALERVMGIGELQALILERVELLDARNLAETSRTNRSHLANTRRHIRNVCGALDVAMTRILNENGRASGHDLRRRGFARDHLMSGMRAALRILKRALRLPRDSTAAVVLEEFARKVPLLAAHRNVERDRQLAAINMLRAFLLGGAANHMTAPDRNRLARTICLIVPQLGNEPHSHSLPRELIRAAGPRLREVYGDFGNIAMHAASLGITAALGLTWVAAAATGTTAARLASDDKTRNKALKLLNRAVSAMQPLTVEDATSAALTQLLLHLPSNHGKHLHPLYAKLVDAAQPLLNRQQMRELDRQLGAAGPQRWHLITGR